MTSNIRILSKAPSVSTAVHPKGGQSRLDKLAQDSVPALKRTYKAPDMLVMLFATVALILELGNVVMFIIAAGMVILFFRLRAYYKDFEWAVHPLRLLIPLSTIFQILYWLWFGVLGDVRPTTQFDWMLPVMDTAWMWYYLGQYLLLHYLFYISMDFGFALYTDKHNTAIQVRYDIIASRAIPITVMIISIYFISNLNFFARTGVHAYWGSISARLYPTAFGVLCLIAFKDRLSSAMSLIGIFLVGSVFVFGVFISSQIGMRFISLQQILITVGLLVTMFHIYRRRDLRTAFIWSLIIGVVLFAVTTIMKIEWGGGEVRFEGYVNLIQFTIERALQRMAQFASDPVVIENNLENILFGDTTVSSIRLAQAIPFLLPLSGYQDPLGLLEVEKNIFFLTLSYTHAFIPEISSSFIGGTSEAVFSFGLVGGMLCILVFAFIQGVTISFSARLCGEYNWANVISQYILYALLGMDLNSFLRLPINLILGAFLLRMLMKPRAQVSIGPQGGVLKVKSLSPAARP